MFLTKKLETLKKEVERVLGFSLSIKIGLWLNEV